MWNFQQISDVLGTPVHNFQQVSDALGEEVWNFQQAKDALERKAAAESKAGKTKKDK